jgi:hypothetical protein
MKSFKEWLVEAQVVAPAQNQQATTVTKNVIGLTTTNPPSPKMIKALTDITKAFVDLKKASGAP